MRARAPTCSGSSTLSPASAPLPPPPPIAAPSLLLLTSAARPPPCSTACVLRPTPASHARASTQLSGTVAAAQRGRACGPYPFPSTLSSQSSRHVPPSRPAPIEDRSAREEPLEDT
eukprot:135755-Rhodomonas_salina.1